MPGMVSGPENDMVQRCGNFRTAGCRHKLLAAGAVKWQFSEWLRDRAIVYF